MAKRVLILNGPNLNLLGTREKSIYGGDTLADIEAMCRETCEKLLRTLDKPIVEVHLSNIHQREPFRHHSYVSAVAKGVICGLGPRGYTLALEAVAEILN